MILGEGDEAAFVGGIGTGRDGNRASGVGVRVGTGIRMTTGFGLICFLVGVGRFSGTFIFLVRVGFIFLTEGVSGA